MTSLDAIRSFRTFVRLASNRRAVDRVLRWATDCADVGSPVVIVGPTDVGKTHLAHAAVAVRDPHRLPTFVAATDLLAGFVNALRDNKVSEYRARVRERPGCLVVEHFEDLRDKPESRAELLHTVAPLAAARRLVITATERARDRSVVADIQESFPGALVARIEAPTARERGQVERAVEARQTAAAELAPLDADSIIARIFSGIVDEDVRDHRPTRLVLVLDPTLRALEGPLQDADFRALVIESNDQHSEAYLGGRVLVTRRTQEVLYDAPAMTFAIIGLDAMLPADATLSPKLARSIVKMISDATLEHHLSRIRNAWVLVLHPEGRHVFRVLE